jgi:hypothetical protein
MGYNESYTTRVCGCGLESSAPGHGPVAGSREHGNKPSGLTKGKVFLGKLSCYYILKKGPDRWS